MFSGSELVKRRTKRRMVFPSSAVTTMNKPKIYSCVARDGDTAGEKPVDSCGPSNHRFTYRLSGIKSIDGTPGTFCTLERSTCIANEQFWTQTCTSDSECGLGVGVGVDAKCKQSGNPETSFCTMTCSGPDDCPIGYPRIGVPNGMCLFGWH